MARFPRSLLILPFAAASSAFAAPPFDLTAALQASQTKYLQEVAQIRAAYSAGKPWSGAAQLCTSALISRANDLIVTVGGQSWQVQSGSTDGVRSSADGSMVAFAAKTGEHASFDPPRKIRAELAGVRRFAKGETMHLKGIINIDPATNLAKSQWSSVLQVHQADSHRANGDLVAASPPFGVGLRYGADGKPIMQVSGETGTGLQFSWAPQRILGATPISFGVDHPFEFTYVDGHGGPGQITVLLDGKKICDFRGPTGYQYVDLLANAYIVGGKPQLTGSYLKMGVYAGLDDGNVPPKDVNIRFTLRDVSN